MAVEDENLDLNSEKNTTHMLIEAAKAAHGYVYYEGKVVYDGDSRPKRIDVYEKYRKPNSKFATILKEQGIEWVVHTRS
jgi:hypothetical protein